MNLMKREKCCVGAQSTSPRLGISWSVRKSTFLAFTTRLRKFIASYFHGISTKQTLGSRTVAATYSTRFVQTNFLQDAVGEIPLPQGSNSYGRSVCTGRLYTGVVPLLMAPLTRSKILVVANNASPVSLLARHYEYNIYPKIFKWLQNEKKLSQLFWC